MKYAFTSAKDTCLMIHFNDESHNYYCHMFDCDYRCGLDW